MTPSRIPAYRIPPVDVGEVDCALKKMKKGKAKGDDEIVTKVGRRNEIIR